MGGDRNTVHLLTRDGGEINVDIKVESWPAMTKEQVATELVARIASTLEKPSRLVSAVVKVEIRQLPHGEGLALPAYQSAHAAGLDLLAAVAGRRAR